MSVWLKSARAFCSRIKQFVTRQNGFRISLLAAAAIAIGTLFVVPAYISDKQPASKTADASQNAPKPRVAESSQASAGPQADQQDAADSTAPAASNASAPQQPSATAPAAAGGKPAPAPAPPQLQGYKPWQPPAAPGFTFSQDVIYASPGTNTASITATMNDGSAVDWAAWGPNSYWEPSPDQKEQQVAVLVKEFAPSDSIRPSASFHVWLRDDAASASYSFVIVAHDGLRGIEATKQFTVIVQ